MPHPIMCTGLDVLSKTCRGLANVLHKNVEQPAVDMQTSLKRGNSVESSFHKVSKPTKPSKKPHPKFTLGDHTAHLGRIFATSRPGKRDEGEGTLENLVVANIARQENAENNTNSRSISDSTLNNGDTTTSPASPSDPTEDSVVDTAHGEDVATRNSDPYDIESLSEGQALAQEHREAEEPISLGTRPPSPFEDIAKPETRIDQLSPTKNGLESKLDTAQGKVQALKTLLRGAQNWFDKEEAKSSSSMSAQQREIMDLKKQLAVEKEATNDAKAELKAITEKYERVLDEQKEFYEEGVSDFERRLEKEKQDRNSAKGNLEQQHAAVLQDLVTIYENEKAELQRFVRMYTLLGVGLFNRLTWLEAELQVSTGRVNRSQEDIRLIADAMELLSNPVDGTLLHSIGFGSVQAEDIAQEDESVLTDGKEPSEEEEYDQEDEGSVEGEYTSEGDEAATQLEDVNSQAELGIEDPLSTEDHDNTFLDVPSSAETDIGHALDASVWDDEESDQDSDDEDPGPRLDKGKAKEVWTDDPVQELLQDVVIDDPAANEWKRAQETADAKLAKKLQLDEWNEAGENEPRSLAGENKPENPKGLRDYAAELAIAIGEGSSRSAAGKNKNIGSTGVFEPTNKPVPVFAETAHAKSSSEQGDRATKAKAGGIFGVSVKEFTDTTRAGNTPSPRFDISFADTARANPFAAKAASVSQKSKAKLRAEVEAAVQKALAQRKEKEEEETAVNEERKLSRQEQREAERLRKKEEKKAGKKARR